MGEWKKVLISSFLQSRSESYDPSDLKIKNLRRLEKIDFDGNIHFSDKPTRTKMIIIQPGDLVISGINVAKGAIAVYEGLEPITATIHYSSYKFDPDKIDIQYFKRFLKSVSFLKAIKEQVRGGIKTEIKAKDFLPIQINLPNIDLQRKINLYFDSFEHELRDLNQEIKNQSDYISFLRKTILQEAIEGKLTADWRKQNPVRKGDPNTDAAALLDKIKLEKEKMIAEGKIKREKPLEPIKPEEIPFELPEGWVWCRLGDISLSIVYGTSQKCSYDETQNSKVLRIPNISKGYIETTDIKYANLNDKERQELSLIHGDVLVIRSNGSPEIVGTMVFVTEEFYGFCFAGYLIRFRFCLPIIGEYISIISKARQIRNQIENPLRTTVGINNVNSQELSNLIIPLPPISEQQAIVNQVNKLVFIVDELEEQVNVCKRQVGELIQVVLKEAFEGKA